MTAYWSALRWALRALWALAVLLVLLLVLWWLRREPAPSAPTKSAAASTWNPSPEITAERWSVFQSSGWTTGVERAGDESVQQRFRLAGTFFLLGGDVSRPSSQRAIVDDLRLKQQSLVGEGEELDGYVVQHITNDRIQLVRNGMVTELLLGFGDPLLAEQAAGGVANPSAEETILETTRFGNRVGEARWVLSRESLLGYYQEILDDPERIAALYMSLKPEYRENEIAGYELRQEGEKEFFQAVGLKEGDKLRKVNSMNMTSQARAEYFIGEFVKSRLNAVVLDIERDGKPEKLIYLVR